MDGGDTEATTPAPGPSAATVSRRRVLGAGVALSTTFLAGCGLRLDLPQPPPPTPTRRQVPDETLLVAFVRDLRQLRADGLRLPAAQRNRAATRDALRLLAQQDDVLTGRLTNAGVPTAVIDAIPTPSVSTTTTGPTPSTTVPTPTTPTPPSPFAAALSDLPDHRWESLATATVTNRPVLVSATSARLATAIRLGRQVPLAGNVSQTLHTSLVEHTAPLVYGFEVVAAQSTGADRRTALGTLDQLRRLLEEVGPEVSGSALPGGWSLPYKVTTPVAAARLAKDLLTTAIAATTTLLAPTPSPSGVAEAATWSARVQALGPAHGIPLSAFPATSGAARS